MRYAAATLSGRVVDMRDEAYSEDTLQALTDAYGEAVTVHEDLDTAAIQAGCGRAKVEDGKVVADETWINPAVKDKLVELYKTKVAMKWAMADGLDLSDELALIEVQILETARKLPASAFSDAPVPEDPILDDPTYTGALLPSTEGPSFFARWAARLRWW